MEWWSKTKGKARRVLIIQKISQEEDNGSLQKAMQQNQQGQWTTWKGDFKRSHRWNDKWHMVQLRISFILRSVYDFLPSNANLVKWGKSEDPSCPLSNEWQTIKHVLRSCKTALILGKYIIKCWRSLWKPSNSMTKNPRPSFMLQAARKVGQPETFHADPTDRACCVKMMIESGQISQSGRTIQRSSRKPAGDPTKSSTPKMARRSSWSNSLGLTKPGVKVPMSTRPKSTLTWPETWGRC